MTPVFSEGFNAVQADHDCRGEGCPVCLLIQRGEDFFRQYKYAAPYSGFSSGVLVPVLLVPDLVPFRFTITSAVQLKVKMNT
ncbi:MAG: hypothetical protein LBK64_03875 [Spirochaetaceae bacterium]|jgi:hypothetical protein|nr:hypothetical protein [Spirochaetaceae bacterium]